MADIIHILERIGRIYDIGIALSEKNHLREIHAITEKNPFFTSGKLCSQLMEKSKGQEIPLIYLDEHSVCFGCIGCGEDFYLFGPMALKRMTQIEVHRYYRTYNIPMAEEMAPYHYTFGQVISLMGLFAELIMDKEYTDKELIMGNHLMVDEAVMEKEIEQVCETAEVFYNGRSIGTKVRRPMSPAGILGNVKICRKNG